MKWETLVSNLASDYGLLIDVEFSEFKFINIINLLINQDLNIYRFKSDDLHLFNLQTYYDLILFYNSKYVYLETCIIDFDKNTEYSIFPIAVYQLDSISDIALNKLNFKINIS